MINKTKETIATSERLPITRKDIYIELGLIFALGFFVGIAIKNEAEKKITIGFDDYKMQIAPHDYVLSKMQEDFLSSRTSERK